MTGSVETSTEGLNGGEGATVAPPIGSGSEHGFPQHFERRPDFMLGRDVVWDVVDASRVRERKVGDLMVVSIADVLSGANEVFLGFGVPNAFLVVPKLAELGSQEQGYQKFAGKSLWREPSVIADTRGLVQSGVWIRFIDPPEEAIERLREAMIFYNGVRFGTCVLACMHVMERAGFTSGAKPLTRHVFPYPLLASLTKNGLAFDGKPVKFEIIRTTPRELPSFSYGIRKATVLTPIRHVNRNKTYAAVKSFVTAPFRWFAGKKPEATKRVVAPVAPALPDGVDYKNDLIVGVSKTTAFGALLRLVWGSHALFEVRQTRVNPKGYFTHALTPFPQANPSFVTRVKKKVLFTPFVIRTIRSILAPEYAVSGARSERDLYDMLRTHSEESPNKYNLVITSTRIVFARVNTDAPKGTIRSWLFGWLLRLLRKISAWILSKHVLMSGYDPETFYACEAWKDVKGKLHLNRESGTFRPNEEEEEDAYAFVTAVFPNLPIVMD